MFTARAIEIMEPERSLPGLKRVVRMRVGEVLTGVDPEQKEVEIVTGSGGGDCGYPFQSGRDYAVYAHKNSDGRLETGICTRTRPLEEAAEDIAYFHAVPTAPATGEIRIVTGVFDMPGIPGVKMRIAGGGSRSAASTDTAGQVRFGGLPPGEYEVTAELAGYLPAERKVQLHAKGCAEVLFRMVLDRRVTGRVTTKDGHPAAGVEVQVRPVKEMSGDHVKTDGEGVYELRHFPAGEYYLGINLNHTPTIENPYPRWYYPGTEDPASATTLFFAEAPETQRFDLTLPDRLKDRVIEGTVLGPDGRPAAGARLFVLDPRWLWQSWAAEATADANGRFQLHVLDGTRYRLHAITLRSSADPVDIQPGNSPLDLRLVLTRKGNSLDEDQRKGTEQYRNRR